MLPQIGSAKLGVYIGSCCRMTLLLGPPSSGKTTLLLALAGRLGPGLKVRDMIPHQSAFFLQILAPQKCYLGYPSQEGRHLLLPENGFRFLISAMSLINFFY